MLSYSMVTHSHPDFHSLFGHILVYIVVLLQLSRWKTVSSLLRSFQTRHVKFPVSWPCKLMITLVTLWWFSWVLFHVKDFILTAVPYRNCLWFLVCISNRPSKVTLKSVFSNLEEQLMSICCADKHIWDTPGFGTGAGRQTYHTMYR